jgi:hypothetical protein
MNTVIDLATYHASTPISRLSMVRLSSDNPRVYALPEAAPAFAMAIALHGADKVEGYACWQYMGDEEPARAGTYYNGV